MRIVCIYPGRFHPFHTSHYEVYNYVTSKFGIDNVYIVTSNKTAADSPFTFKLKLLIMSELFGIPKKQILNIRNPYKVESLYSIFDNNETILVYVSTEKDPRLRSGKYFKGALPKNPKPYSLLAYTINVPHMSNKFEGSEISGTTVRTVFGSLDLSVLLKKDAFKSIFGRYNELVFNLLISKLGENVEEQLVILDLITEGIHDRGNFKCVFMAGTPAAGKSTTCQDLFRTEYNVSSYGLKVVNPDYPFVKYLQKDNLPPLFETIGKLKWDSTKARAVDVFLKQFKMFVEARKGIIVDRTCGRDVDLITRKDMVLRNGYDTMMVFVTTPLWLALKRNAARERHVGLDTVRLVYHSVNSFKLKYRAMFGLNFVEVNTLKGENVDYKIKSKIVKFINKPVLNPIALNWIRAQKKLRGLQTESVLELGGSAGHLKHPFEDNKLTFGNMKQMVLMVLSGLINVEPGVTMKLDGQNLLISWKNNKLVSSRNIGQLKNFGLNAVDISGILTQFEGRGSVRDAFVFALNDLERAFKSLSKKTLIEIFNEGHKWINLEIIYDKLRNVIPYDSSMLVFHDIRTVDLNGLIIHKDVSQSKIIYKALVKTNSIIQKNFTIKPPAVVKVPASKDFASRRDYFIAKISRLQNKYKLSDDNTLLDYHRAVWNKFIRLQALLYNYIIELSVLNGLTNRWANFDKSYSLAKFKKLCNNKDFLKFVISFDKEDHSRVFKLNAFLWLVIFLLLGVLVMKNLSDYLMVDPKAVTKKLVALLNDTITQIKATNNIKMLSKLLRSLKRLQAIGGTESIVPAEGIVFLYKGETYKLTGAFADLNHIIGMLIYLR